jgi:hypothetical protein
VEFFSKIIDERLVPEHPADSAVTDVDDILPHGLTVDEVIESGQLFQFKGRHAEKASPFDHGFIVEITIMMLQAYITSTASSLGCSLSAVVSVTFSAKVQGSSSGLSDQDQGRI